MIVTRAGFANFRNIESLEVSFSDGVNVLWGMNGQGKSNILEGIYYFARGRSFRAATDRDLIRFGTDAAVWSIDYSGSGDSVFTLGAALSGGKKRLTRNGATLTGTSEMIGNFKAVLFSPANLSIVNGGPSVRRSFLDIAIGQLNRSYVSSLSVYRRNLFERNALLKRYASGNTVTNEEWEVYAQQLAVSGAEVCSERERYCLDLSRYTGRYFSGMSGDLQDCRISYRSYHLSKLENEDGLTGKDRIRDLLYEKLMSNIDREMYVGSTLYGPHKDDIEILVNGHDAKTFASQGQQRSIALSMKLSEGEISKEASGSYPVFLLDDVFSELDEKRRKYIMEELCNRQIIITSCEPMILSGVVKEGTEIRYLNVEGGNITGR